MILNNDTALMRGIRTMLQAIVGLLAAVWAVPGVPDAFHNYVAQNYVSVALAVGVPAGLAGFLWNALRHDVKNI